MVPTRCGPVDVTTFRGTGVLQDDLAVRDLTVNAMAWDPDAGRLHDPFGGREDLAAGRLRAVGEPSMRLSEDPLRALRVGRLIAQLGFSVDPQLERACAAAATTLRTVARERIGREMSALLTAPHPDLGLAFLRRTGIAESLAPGTRDDAPAVAALLPPDLALRCAGWLRGSNAESVILRMRLPRSLALRVARLLALHPVDQAVSPDRPAAVRRLMRRAGEENLPHLFSLRRAELSVGQAGPEADAALKRLEALGASLVRIREEGNLALGRRDLALDGRAVMLHLGCRPGRSVGLALEHLTERVLEDPSCNTADGLRSILDAWRVEQGDAL
jgi:tRNA nucleotidyltransferase (CCA-adding enzyme)